MRRRIMAVLSLLLACMLAGCSAEVEPYLVPPRPQGEQKEIAQALEAYVKGAFDKGTRLSLRYPKSGEYTSAFILTDLEGRPAPQTSAGASYAIAFYRTGAEGSSTHINLLHREEDGWKSIDDAEGLGTDIERVEFGDLSGDGVPEMLLGWSIYNSQDRQLHIYSLAGGRLAPVSTDGVYTLLHMDDMTDSGRDNLLLLRIGSGNQVTARLMAMQEGRLAELGSARLDGFIQQFGKVQIDRLADGVRGIYIDAYKDASTLITELLYWDGSRLEAPFYDPVKNITAATARGSGIPSMDIDGDGQIEYPQCVPLPGYEEEQNPKDYMWLTDWYAWDYAAGAPRSKTAAPSLVNVSDGYCVWLEEGWRGRVTVEYTQETRTLWLKTVENGVAGQAFMALRTKEAGDTVSVAGESLVFRSWASHEATGRGYSVWYDENSALGLDTLKIQHMLSQLLI